MKRYGLYSNAFSFGFITTLLACTVGILIGGALQDATAMIGSSGVLVGFLLCFMMVRFTERR